MIKKILVVVIFLSCIASHSGFLLADDKTERQDKINKELDKFGIKPGGGNQDSGSKDSGSQNSGGAKKDEPAKPGEKPLTNGSVTNTGEVSINIRTTGKDGKLSEPTTLKPGEKMDLPAGTVEVDGNLIKAEGKNVNFSITQPNGQRTDVYNQHQPDWATGKVNQPNTIYNATGETVIVKGKTQSGEISITQVESGKYADLPSGTKEVRVERDPLNTKGEKYPSVDVVGPDGSRHEIRAFKKWEKATEDKPADNKSTSQADFDKPGIDFAGNPSVRGSEIGGTGEVKAEGAAAQCLDAH